MIRFGKTMLLAGAAVASLSTASAAEFIGTTTVSSSAIDPANSGSGLTIDVTNEASLDFTLDAQGDTYMTSVFTISTPEGSVEGDDTTQVPISVTFSFTDPSNSSGSVNGQTFGRSTLFGAIQNGRITFNGPATITFDTGDVLTVSLANTNFSGGLGGLSGSSANVQGTFTYTDVGAAVPEPASWALMITGFGAMGATARRRRQLFAAA